MHAAIVDDDYCVTVEDWRIECEFAKALVANLESFVEYSTNNTLSLAPCKMPKPKYLNEIVYRFMKERYGWNEGKDYRSWCRQNKDKILTVEVFGAAHEKNPVALYMRFSSQSGCFEFKLM
ncbi:hypothetical protein Asfd1_230 [Aeromonas phage Asfd_1]|nr:hypothetical protein Asfd1_230 [Aeromonas phage Asfd_1]